MGTYRYSTEFRTDAIALAGSSDRPLARVAWDLGMNHETLRQWVKAAERAEDAFSQWDGRILAAWGRKLRRSRSAGVDGAESLLGSSSAP